MSQDECMKGCGHKAKQRRTDVVCNLYIESGNCTQGQEGDEVSNVTIARWGHVGDATIARWGYDVRLRRCRPFYFSGCFGNENNFASESDCQQVCPTTFPPLITLQDEILFERNAEYAVIPVTIRANPLADVKWIRKGIEISEFDFRYQILQDHSLRFKDVSDLDAGSFTVIAENGIGKPDSKTVEVVVYPMRPSAKIKLEKSIFKPESDFSIPCDVKGYPPPDIKWFRISSRTSSKTEIKPQYPHLDIETYQTGTSTTKSILNIRNASEIDTGKYLCQAHSSHFPVSPASDSQGILIQFAPGERCFDSPAYSHCHQVVKYKFCGNKYYGQYCCRSCTDAGFLPGGVHF